MDFFKSGLKTVLGTPESGNLPSPAETVSFLFIVLVFVVKEHLLLYIVIQVSLQIQFAFHNALVQLLYKVLF